MHIKYVASKVITIYTPITGIFVIPFKKDVNIFLTHSETVLKKSPSEFCRILYTCSGILIFSKSISFIKDCIWLDTFSIYPFKPCNKFELSEMALVIPNIIKPIKIENTNSKTNIALVFLVNFVLFATFFINGSTIKDITNAIKKGIKKTANLNAKYIATKLTTPITILLITLVQ